MVSYKVAINSGRSAGSEPSGPTGTGLVGVCRTGSPKIRMGTTAMVGKLIRPEVARLAGLGYRPTVGGVVEYRRSMPLHKDIQAIWEFAGRVQRKRYGQRHGAGRSIGGRLRNRRWPDPPRT